MKLAIIDTETGGLDLTTTGVCEVAAIYLDTTTGEQYTIMDERCKPSFPMMPQAIDVHGITEESVEGKPRDIDVLLKLYNQLQLIDDVVICGFNSTKYDFPLIDNLLKQNILAPPYPFCRMNKIDILGYVRIDKDLMTLPRKRLVDVYEHVTGKQSINAHSALYDCQMVCDIIMKKGGSRWLTTMSKPVIIAPDKTNNFVGKSTPFSNFNRKLNNIERKTT